MDIHTPPHIVLHITFKVHLPIYMQVHEGGHNQQFQRIKGTKTQIQNAKKGSKEQVCCTSMKMNKGVA